LLSRIRYIEIMCWPHWRTRLFKTRGTLDYVDLRFHQRVSSHEYFIAPQRLLSRGTNVVFKLSSTITHNSERTGGLFRGPGLLRVWVSLKSIPENLLSLMVISNWVTRKSMDSHIVTLALMGQFRSSKDLLPLPCVCFSDHLLSLFLLLLFFNPRPL